MAGSTEETLQARLADTEKRLHSVTERYALATAAAKVGVWDWDLGVGVFHMDPNLKALLGYQDHELPNNIEAWSECVHPDDREAVTQAAADAIEGRAPEFLFEHRMCHKDGSVRWFLARGEVIRDAAGAPVRFVGTDADVTDRVRLEQEFRELSSVVQTQIGHDLHDSLGQELTALALKTSVLEHRLAAVAPHLVPAAKEVRGLAESAIRTTEALARGLSPVLSSAGLGHSLEELAENARRLFAIACTVTLPEDIVQRFSRADANELYRIAQEAVTNAVRHGRATAVAIEGRVAGGRFLLEIADDGSGIVGPEPPGRSMGLRIMRYRARNLGGNLTVGRRAQGGTLVVCSCPVPE
jgi:PAS domain S-box-containing protein